MQPGRPRTQTQSPTSNSEGNWPATLPIPTCMFGNLALTPQQQHPSSRRELLCLLVAPEKFCAEELDTSRRGSGRLACRFMSGWPAPAGSDVHAATAEMWQEQEQPLTIDRFSLEWRQFPCHRPCCRAAGTTSSCSRPRLVPSRFRRSALPRIGSCAYCLPWGLLPRRTLSLPGPVFGEHLSGLK